MRHLKRFSKRPRRECLFGPQDSKSQIAKNVYAFPDMINNYESIYSSPCNAKSNNSFVLIDNSRNVINDRKLLAQNAVLQHTGCAKKLSKETAKRDKRDTFAVCAHQDALPTFLNLSITKFTGRRLRHAPKQYDICIHVGAHYSLPIQVGYLASSRIDFSKTLASLTPNRKVQLASEMNSTSIRLIFFNSTCHSQLIVKGSPANWKS